MRDVIEIWIGDYRYTRFKSYRIEHDIYNAAASFDFELFPDPAGRPKAGDLVKVFIDGVLELTGMIDRVTYRYEKSGRSISVYGRDLMGLVVDSYVETWGTLRNTDLIELAKRLLRDVPYIDHEKITGDDAARDRKPSIQTSPGNKIFDVLKDAALSRGLLFFAQEDGVLCFRKPKGRGACVLAIKRKHGEANTYIIRGEYTQDFSDRYSKYTVLTQGDGFFSDEGGRFNAIARETDDAVTYHKPFVEVMNEDGGSVRKRAKDLKAIRAAQSNVLKYTVIGHSQGAFPWAVNELVHIDDDEFMAHGEFLISGRVFELTQDGGKVTHLTIGTKGVVV